MDLTVLGSSGGSPTRTNPASGYLVTHGRTAVWLDAGTGTFMELARHLDPGTLSAVVLSHVHVDHCSDIFGLYGYLAFGPSGVVPVPVYGPDGVGEHLAEFARAGSEHVFRSVLDLHSVDPGERIQLGEMQVSFGAAVHPVPAVVTRLESGGRALVYSGDTGPGGDLVDVAAGADLLLCEATMAGDRDDRTYPYHLTAAEAGRAAAAANVQRLVITHLGVATSVEVALEEAADGFGAPVTWAAPGAKMDL